MEQHPIFKPRNIHGQGKAAMTLLTEDGCIYPIIAHQAKNDRNRTVSSAPQGRVPRGLRPMHTSTLVIAKPPWEPDYTTTHKQYYGGSKMLEPEPPVKTARSMHHSPSEIEKVGALGTCSKFSPHEIEDIWKSVYTKVYIPKETIPASQLHLSTLVNRIHQTDGHEVQEAVKPSKEPMSYFTQYKRVHDKLGHILGPGVPREFPVREQYNVLTGQPMGPAWKPENLRVSGNRVLHSIRREHTSIIQ